MSNRPPFSLTVAAPDTVISEHMLTDFLASLQTRNRVLVTVYGPFTIRRATDGTGGTAPGTETETYTVLASTEVLPLVVDEVHREGDGFGVYAHVRHDMDLGSETRSPRYRIFVGTGPLRITLETS